MTHRNFTAAVKGAAFGQWPYILQQLAGLTDLQVDTRTRSTGTACPLCGGHDRYSFKSDDEGGWACRHCGGGDGFTLLMKLHGWDFTRTVQQVASLLGLSQDFPEELDRLRKEAEERRRVHEQQNQQKKQQQQAEGIQEANRFWDNSVPYRRHPYAEYKRFSPFLKSLCRQLDDWLLVPVYSPDGFLMNIQRFVNYMPTDGSRWPRYFVRNAPVKGGWLAYGPDSHHVLITEGVADADACYQIESGACKVVCAFSANQFSSVAKLVRQYHPDSEIILCPDSDPAGLKHAIKATTEVHGCLISQPPTPYKDWSDFFISQQEVA
ncbi:primase-helicase zinc-binding domain-containing protein [Endozoicomonas sp. 4G]|uniref:primase-helicase zinc-binding domain-containing protein n=1 Tax=Endozoicomonas sp. 4G TaxID=2872754 RepID=UPI0020791430|nr:primase-helicase zinc-binding domain-containing protein [Endozoicomonas sp. 4G]